MKNDAVRRTDWVIIHKALVSHASSILKVLLPGNTKPSGPLEGPDILIKRSPTYFYVGLTSFT